MASSADKRQRDAGAAHLAHNLRDDRGTFSLSGKKYFVDRRTMDATTLKGSLIPVFFSLKAVSQARPNPEERRGHPCHRKRWVSETEGTLLLRQPSQRNTRVPRRRAKRSPTVHPSVLPSFLSLFRRPNFCFLPPDEKIVNDRPLRRGHR